jgi:hypothetical protein
MDKRLPTPAPLLLIIRNCWTDLLGDDGTEEFKPSAGVLSERYGCAQNSADQKMEVGTTGL